MFIIFNILAKVTMVTGRSRSFVTLTTKRKNCHCLSLCCACVFEKYIIKKVVFKSILDFF